MRRADGEMILFWTLPVLAVIWISAFFLFPGFTHPMSPSMTAQQVADFYRNPANLSRIRYSMILFNWFGVGLIPLLTLLVMRDPQLTLLLNDLAWMFFTTSVPFLIGQSLIVAAAIYLDTPERPVFRRWVAHFNIVIAAALVPAAFTGLALSGPMAWNGLLPFWCKNIAIAVWIVVMSVVLGRNIYRQRATEEAVPA